jgi:glutamyl-tRNA reductase
MEISVFGANFRSAPLELREQLALAPQGVLKLLKTVRAEGIFAEAVVLSTCNRTEVYYAGAEDGGGLGHVLEHLAEVKGVAGPGDSSAFYRYGGEAAVRHVFAVAASLDSQVVGEHEILGQVKDAYRLALEARTARFLMQKLMHAAFRVGKRVQTETALGQGTASIPQAAVCLAQEVFGSLADKCVLVVGAGATAELVAGALIRAGAASLIVANRTLSRAQQLAESVLSRRKEKLPFADTDCAPCPRRRRIACRSAGKAADDCPLRGKGDASSQKQLTVRAVEMSQIASAIGGADLVICSTGAPQPVLRAEELSGALERSGRAVLMIDIAMPRDIDPAVGAIPGVRLCNIDDLEGMVSANVRRRLAEVPRAEAIVEQEVGRFCHWLQSLAVVPTVKLLRQRADRIVERELRRYGGRLSGLQRGEMEAFARSLFKKVLHNPLAFLNSLSSQGEESSSLESLDLLRRMFGLDAQDGDGNGD